MLCLFRKIQPPSLCLGLERAQAYSSRAIFLIEVFHHLFTTKRHHLFFLAKLVQTIDLGNEGLVPLELRFLHNPDTTEGFVGATLSSNVIRFFKKEVSTSRMDL